MCVRAHTHSETIHKAADVTAAGGLRVMFKRGGGKIMDRAYVNSSTSDMGALTPRSPRFAHVPPRRSTAHTALMHTRIELAHACTALVGVCR
jgi:hypothetical protein